MENPINPVPQYRRPPVVERVVTLWAEVDQERHESLFEEWREMVEQDYPVYEPLKEWLLKVEEKDGIPLLDGAQTELKITPRFSRKKSSEGFDWSIRCPAGQLTMNMHSSPDEIRRYADLRSEYFRWMGTWLTNFEVARLHRLQVLYLNKLSPETLPDFKTEAGALELGRVLKVFMSIPGEHECLVPPWDCRANVLLAEPRGALLEIHLKDASHPGGKPVLDLSLTVNVDMKDTPADAEKVAGVLDLCHQRIVERFEQLFTDEARQSFDPIVP